MERLTYDFCIGGNHCWQVKGADNLECREVCERQGDDGCKTCPIAKAFDRLAAIEDVLGDDYDLDRLRELWKAGQEGKAHIGRCLDCKHYEGLAVCEYLGDCGGTNWICGWFEPKEEKQDG